MKSFLCAFLFLCCFRTSAQFAIITDSDGYVNVREDAGTGSNIVDKLSKDHLIYCFENKGNWTNIDYTRNNKELNGYVHKDKYKSVDDFKKFSVDKQSTGIIVLRLDSITITLTSSAFDKKKHRFKYLKDYPEQIDLIDNKKYWGKDGGIPISQFEKMVIIFGDTSIILSDKAVEGLYEPNLSTASATYDNDNDVVYIQTINGDGAGSYEVLWRIEKKSYKDRLVANGF